MDDKYDNIFFIILLARPFTPYKMLILQYDEGFQALGTNQCVPAHARLVVVLA